MRDSFTEKIKEVSVVLLPVSETERVHTFDQLFLSCAILASLLPLLLDVIVCHSTAYFISLRVLKVLFSPELATSLWNLYLP